MYGGNKYLWGNVPALDLLQLKDNEGEDYCQGLSLLLAGMRAEQFFDLSYR